MDDTTTRDAGPATANDKAATLIMTLSADSGYQSVETHRVSAETWARIVAIAQDREGATVAQDGHPITMTYRNYRGEVAKRTVTPKLIWWGSTDWHPEPGWLMTAYDPDKSADRDFALADCQFADLSPVAQDAEPVADQIQGLIIAAKAAGLTDRVEGLRDALDFILRPPARQPRDEAASLRDHLTRAKSAADDALAKAKADQADEGTRIKLKMTAHTLGLLLEEDIQ